MIRQQLRLPNSSSGSLQAVEKPLLGRISNDIDQSSHYCVLIDRASE
jgi:hypothetical protein